MKKKYITIIIIVVLAIAGLVFWLTQNKAHAPQTNQNTKSTATQEKSEQPATTPTFNKQLLSLDDPTSSWVVVNKKRPLSPRSYAPQDLVIPNVALRSNITGNEKYMRKEAAQALEAMISAASKAGMQFNLQSGYRSYGFQDSLYNRYVQQQGQAVADTQSARPGYSEHQTGLAVDVGSVNHPECAVEQCFSGTPEGHWLAENAHAYGFIIRYPEGKDATTGYIYEPWHIRYVGTDLAEEMHRTNASTMEEFFGLPAAGSY